MRKITQQIAQAWLYHKKLTVGNTTTDGAAVWLHGNKIAWRDSETSLCWHFTLAGWNTPTTRERLNGLLDAIGANKAGFCQRKGKAVFINLKGEEREISSFDVLTINF